MVESTGVVKRPRVALGLMQYGPPGSEAKIQSLDEFNEHLDYFQSRGYHEVDTARTYVDGAQEGWTKLAKWRERKLTLATKWWPYSSGDHAPEKVKDAMNKSLEELGTDCIDIWYLHAPDRTVSFEDTLRAVNELHQEGKFKQLGLSNYASWEVAEIWNICNCNGWVKPTVYQAMYNCLTRAIEEELVPCCRKYGLSILNYNQLAGGLLTGRYQNMEIPPNGSRYSNDHVYGQLYRERFFRNANFEALEIIRPVARKHGLTLLEIAFRWCVHHSALNVMGGPNGDGVVLGISSLSQLEANLNEIEKGPLPEEIVDKLEQAWQITKGTAVGYWRQDEEVASA